MISLRNLRESKNLTQEQLAQLIGISRKTISAYETGRAVPSITVLKKLSRVLNVSTDILLDSVQIETKQIETEKEVTI